MQGNGPDLHVAEAQGSGDFSPLWSGQNASGCKEIPAAQLTRELAAASDDGIVLDAALATNERQRENFWRLPINFCFLISVNCNFRL